MKTPEQTEARTRAFARVMGPYLVIVTVTAIARAPHMRTLLSEFDASPVWPWVTGAFVLLSGLIVVGLHRSWRGLAAIAVSLLGWSAALKGFFLLAFPQSYISAASDAVGAVDWWRAGFIVMAIVGVYLTYIGWAPGSSRPAAPAKRATPDIPRAA